METTVTDTTTTTAEPVLDQTVPEAPAETGKPCTVCGAVAGSWADTQVHPDEWIVYKDGAGESVRVLVDAYLAAEASE